MHTYELKEPPMAEYTPSDEDMREKYLWAHAREAEGMAEQSYALQVCGEVWDAWLAAHDARVRRDAARETLDGLIDAAQREHDRAPAPYRYRFEKVVSIATEYRDTHYPETED